jgi:hypothetical protein
MNEHPITKARKTERIASEEMCKVPFWFARSKKDVTRVNEKRRSIIPSKMRAGSDNSSALKMSAKRCGLINAMILGAMTEIHEVIMTIDEVTRSLWESTASGLLNSFDRGSPKPRVNIEDNSVKVVMMRSYRPNMPNP